MLDNEDLVADVVAACEGMDREQILDEIAVSSQEVADPEKLADFILAKQAEGTEPDEPSLEA